VKGSRNGGFAWDYPSVLNQQQQRKGTPIALHPKEKGGDHSVISVGKEKRSACDITIERKNREVDIKRNASREKGGLTTIPGKKGGTHVLRERGERKKKKKQPQKPWGGGSSAYVNSPEGKNFCPYSSHAERGKNGPP